MEVYGKDRAIDARTVDIGAVGDQRVARMGLDNESHSTSHAAVAERVSRAADGKRDRC